MKRRDELGNGRKANYLLIIRAVPSANAKERKADKRILFPNSA